MAHQERDILVLKLRDLNRVEKSPVRSLHYGRYISSRSIHVVHVANHCL